MKFLKNTLVSLAFVLAVGGVFATSDLFFPTQAYGEVSGSNCILGDIVTPQNSTIFCDIHHTGTICEVEIAPYSIVDAYQFKSECESVPAFSLLRLNDNI